MNGSVLKVKRLPNYGTLPLPTRGTAYSSGLDLYVALEGVGVVAACGGCGVPVAGVRPTRLRLGSGSSSCYPVTVLRTPGGPSFFVLEPGDRASIPLGLQVEIPLGYELQVRCRSGLAWKHGAVLVQGVGTVDADYRGELAALVINHGKDALVIQHGDRIAQAVVCPVILCSVEEVDELGETVRGSGGFGSTGVQDRVGMRSSADGHP